jgi:PKHD-type hydroxylase
MNYKYWYFESVLSNKFINQINKLAKLEKKNLGKVTKESIEDKKMRNSFICFLSNKIIFDAIHPYIHVANKNAGWNFQWDRSEHAQYTEYNKNQHYGWHKDSWDEPYAKVDDPLSYGKIRKLSVSCSLNDSKEYKGGELQFDFSTPLEKNKIITCKEILKKGSIVVFPSNTWHRVTPVTKGVRRSLVLWNLGNPYV